MFAKWCKETSANGISDWYQSRVKKTHFLFWTLIMITVMVSTVYFTYGTVKDYFTRPTVTNVITKQDYNLELPEVMLCYNGGLNVDSLRKSGFSETFIKSIHARMLPYGNIHEDSAWFVKSKQEMNAYLSDTKTSVKQFMKKFTYSCQQLVELVLNPNNWPRDKIDYCANVDTTYSTYFGACHVFRNNGVQMYPGLDGGIMLHPKVPTTSFYHYNKSLATGYGLSNSFFISIDRKFHWITRKFSLISPNVKAFMVLSLRRYVRLSSANPCDSSKNVYSANTCFHRCYAQFAYEYCKCYELEYLEDQNETNNENHPKICTLFDICNFTWQPPAKACQANCRPICNEYVYDSTVTYTQVAEDLSGRLKSMIWIGYDSMQYTQYEEVNTFTMDMGLANVGGQLGLWLGVSVVTIIQAIYYCCLACCNGRSKHRTVVQPVKAITRYGIRQVEILQADQWASTPSTQRRHYATPKLRRIHN